VLFGVSALLGATFGALSNGFGLIMRQEEALIGATQFILLPLTFPSSTFLAVNLIPKWMQRVADFNPVNWAVTAGRTATSAHPDWGLGPPGRRSWQGSLCSAWRSRRTRSVNAKTPPGKDARRNGPTDAALAAPYPPPGPNS
jgi:ABC-2 type transport system permease protein